MRNCGAKIARGDLVAFLDADCAADPGWLNAAAAHFESPDVVATGSYPEVGGDEISWLQRWWVFLARKPSGSREVVHWLGSANLIVRKSAFDRIGGFDERLESCEDVDLCCRLIETGTILYDDAVKVFHYREPRTLWEFFRKELWHGKNSYDGLLGGRLTPRELPSLVAPLVYLVGFASFVGGIAIVAAYGNATVSAIGLLAMSLPALAYTGRAVLTKGNILHAPTFLLIYWVYFTARAVSLLRSVGAKLARA